MTNLQLTCINKVAADISEDAEKGALAGAAIYGIGKGYGRYSDAQRRVAMGKVPGGHSWTGVVKGIQTGVNHLGKGALIGAGGGMLWNRYVRPRTDPGVSYEDVKYASAAPVNKPNENRLLPKYYQTNVNPQNKQNNGEGWVTPNENRTDVTGML